jgi:translation initiation factor 3 subunit D
MWGIVKAIVDICMKLDEGKYVLVKDPTKPQVRLYEVPADSFENDYLEEPIPEEEQMPPPPPEEETTDEPSNEQKEVDADADAV